MASKEKFFKSDMDKLGIFKEMSYIGVDDPYKSVKKQNFNDAATKGKQLSTVGTKERSALNDGYFDSKFSRAFEGEAYTDQIKLARVQRMEETKSNIGKPFVPSSGEKKPSGSGSFYGTLSGPSAYLSPEVKSAGKEKPQGKNLYTNPSKKGSGYGYQGVTIGKNYEYMSDNYDAYKEVIKKDNDEHKKLTKAGAFKINMAPKDYFDENPFRVEKVPAAVQVDATQKIEKPKSSDGDEKVKPFRPTSFPKKDGGMKAGTFEPHPAHSEDLYSVKQHSNKKQQHNNNSAGSTAQQTFYPTSGPKDVPVHSVLHQNVDRAINSQNYTTIRSVITY